MKEYGHRHAIIRTANHAYLLSEYAEKEWGRLTATDFAPRPCL